MTDTKDILIGSIELLAALIQLVKNLLPTNNITIKKKKKMKKKKRKESNN